MSHIKKFINFVISTRSIFVLAALFSILAWSVSYKLGYVLTYNDGASHLNIARRILDNYTPGLAQIGTVWLPLPHILMFFLAWNDFLWHTALAGSIISMAAYITSMVFTYRLVTGITEKKRGGVVAALVLGLNPNFLYLQTTPMTESLLLAMFVLSAYALFKYAQTKSVMYLVLTGIFVMLSTLIRYDGWFLFAFLFVAIPIWSTINYGIHKAEGHFFLFATVGGLGILLWVLYNWTIFGSPLYFLYGPYSAYAQQRVLSSAGELVTEKNLFLSAWYYMWAVIDNNGMILVAASILSLFIAPFFIQTKKYLLVVLVLLTPFAFNIFALYAGQSAMNVPQAFKDAGLFNIRYGLMMLPGIAVLLGIVASKFRPLWFLVVGLLVAQTFLFVKAGIPITLADGLNGVSQTYYTVEASKWFKEHYSGGLTLVSLASHDAFVARAGIPMKNYIQEGNGKYWEQALNNPSQIVKYVVILTYPPDAVYKRLKSNYDFQKKYVKIHNYKEFEIYERKDAPDAAQLSAAYTAANPKPSPSPTPAAASLSASPKPSVSPKPGASSTPQPSPATASAKPQPKK